MTETTLPAPQPNAAEAADDAELRAAVRGALRGVAKAWRAHLLYEGQSPALDRIVEQLRETLRDTLTRVPFFTVAVEERELHWNGLVVYQGDDASVDRSGNARRPGAAGERAARGASARTWPSRSTATGCARWASTRASSARSSTPSWGCWRASPGCATSRTTC